MPLLIRFVHRPIALNYELGLVAVEVSNVVAKLVLPPEFESEQLTVAQKLPQHCFRRCLFFAQLARTFHQTGKLKSPAILSSLTPSTFGRGLGRGLSTEIAALQLLLFPSPPGRGVRGEGPQTEPLNRRYRLINAEVLMVFCD